MGSNETKKKLVGPWQTIHGVIWVIGIYLLWTRNWWWPGILVLVAISALYEAMLRQYVPEAYSEEKTDTAGATEPASTLPELRPLPVTPAQAPMLEHRMELLPQVCPNCNAPIRGHEVRWTGAQSADCPYCGSNLPMNKA